jgi:hypothetical protein
MTKARDLSSLIGSSGQIDNTKITLDANEIPALDTAKITTGTFDASRIGSGTFADARISASSVSQHATSFDDNKIVNDISTLALRQASDQNKSAYNTNSSFVDVFQDSTGIDTTTDTYRDTASEYVASGSKGSLQSYDYDNANTTARVYWNGMVSGNNTSGNDILSTDAVGKKVIPSYAVANNQEVTYSSGSSGVNIWMKYDFGSNIIWDDKVTIGKKNTWGDVTQWRLAYSTDDVTYTAWDASSASQYSLSGSSTWNGGGAFSSGDSSGNIYITQHTNGTTSTNSSILTLQGLPEITARYFKLTLMNLTSGNSDYSAGLGAFAPWYQPTTFSATGNFTGTTITAPSSVSSMGAIITYQDNAGTNALNTDIVLQLSADGGSNYSTATLTALPDFSTGIKMAKVNDLAVTAGTSLKYKISFANQASGTKEARIRGVALQY